MGKAACFDNPLPFFPERGEKADTAKSICKPCPVKKECADYAKNIEPEYGIWHGRLYQAPAIQRR